MEKNKQRRVAYRRRLLLAFKILVAVDGCRMEFVEGKSLFSLYPSENSWPPVTTGYNNPPKDLYMLYYMLYMIYYGVLFEATPPIKDLRSCELLKVFRLIVSQGIINLVISNLRSIVRIKSWRILVEQHSSLSHVI